MSSGPMSVPWSEIGRLQSDVTSLENKMHGKADKYELSSIKNDVASLESSFRELDAKIDRMEYRLQALEEDKVRREAAV